MFCLEKPDDLMMHPDTAYTKLLPVEYEPEKGLLELYRNFVSEMLKMSLAGVAVLGFLQKFISNNGTPSKLPYVTKMLGILSMSSFAVSAIFALFFLYLSAEGYRYYIAGLRAKTDLQKYEPRDYIYYRRFVLCFCVFFKAGSAFLLGLGAILAVIAIATVLF